MSDHRVLHVVPALGRGGPARCLPDGARIVSLAPALVEPDDLDLVDAPGPDRLHEEVAAADVVHLHFWNAPEAYEFLETPLPPLRLAVWAHVAGTVAPQVLIPGLADAADRLVVAVPQSLEVAPGADVILPTADTGRLLDLQPAPHPGFAVGYVGTVDFVKLHPGFVAMSARVRAPDARFVVAGGGDGFAALAGQAERLGVRDRFELAGWQADVAPLLARLDVFGYPLAPDTSAAAELALQEAMAAGVPAVVLPHAGPAWLVRHGESGLVADGPDEYARAIDRLHADPEERARLGRGAREQARREFSRPAMGERWRATYGELMEIPKRPGPRLPAAPSGAERFVRSLGAAGAPFAASLAGEDPEAVRAGEREIAAAPAGLRSAAVGGIVHYRLRYPDDPHLRLWAGLTWREQGRPALAAGELTAALRLGLGGERVTPYLEPEVAEALT